MAVLNPTSRMAGNSRNATFPMVKFSDQNSNIKESRK
jgi:hypothetical protein